MLARIRELNRLELAGETVRAPLEALAAAAPGWLAGVIDASWQLVYGQRIDELRLPESHVFDRDVVVVRHPRAVGKGVKVLDLDLEILLRKPGALPGATALVQARRRRVHQPA